MMRSTYLVLSLGNLLTSESLKLESSETLGSQRFHESRARLPRSVAIFQIDREL